MRIAVVGLGLIGGSLAKAIKAKTNHTVGGLDNSSQVLAQALYTGAIDETVPENFSSYDLVLISLYPADTIDFLKKYKDSFSPNALVVDMCGIKQAVCKAGKELFASTGIAFIGGHPMAGRECSGFENATSSLFEGASMILTPEPDTEPSILEKAETFFLSLGFGRITLTTPEHHDKIIAYTSQLAHVVSSAYIQSPVATEFMGFSAGSFKDLTRVAKLNEVMWTELFLANSGPLIEQIDTIQQNLTDFRELIATGQKDKLQSKLKNGREIKEKTELDVKKEDAQCR